MTAKRDSPFDFGLGSAFASALGFAFFSGLGSPFASALGFALASALGLALATASAFAFTSASALDLDFGMTSLSAPATRGLNDYRSNCLVTSSNVRPRNNRISSRRS